MGAWGTAVFSDDLALDVRTTYEDLLLYDRTPEEAERITIAEYDMEDPETEPAAWFALAATEWRCGRQLSERVKARALELIETGEDMSVWETNKQRADRQKALDKLKEQLLSPLPEPKRLKKLRVVKCPWQIGDILAIKMPASPPTNAPDDDDWAKFMELIHNRSDLLGKYALIQLVGTKPVKLSKYAPDSDSSDEAYFCIYHWWGDDLSGARDAIAAQQLSYKQFTSRMHWKVSITRSLPLSSMLNISRIATSTT